MASTRDGETEAQQPANQSDTKLTLYWLEKSRSHRILWLLEELNVEYEVKTFKRQGQLAPPELKEIHPLGKSPLLTIESPRFRDGKPIVLAESGAIIEYLIDHFGPHLAPNRYPDETVKGQVGMETESWFRYRYFMHYAEGSLMLYLVVKLIFNTIKAKSPFFIRPIAALIAAGVDSQFLTQNVKNHFDFLEDQLATSPNNGQYLCGPELSGADFLLQFPLSAARGRFGLTEETYPKIYAYVERLEAYESFKRAVQKIIEVDGHYDPNI